MVKLCAFGEPSVYAADGTRLDGVARHTKRFALFLYLACHQRERPRRRDELMAVFWPEADGHRGRNCLRQALYVLKEGMVPGILVSSGEHEVSVDPTRMECDVTQFLLALREGALETALRLHSGDFLQGFFLPGAPEFGFWAEELRARLRVLAAHAAKNLAHTAEGEKALSNALFWWRRTMELTPFDEGVIRRVMALLAGSGNRCEALAEFNRFRDRMESELGLEPSRRTLNLASLVSSAPPDQIPMWVGDRRRKPSPDPASPWRRAVERSPG